MYQVDRTDSGVNRTGVSRWRGMSTDPREGGPATLGGLVSSEPSTPPTRQPYMSEHRAAPHPATLHALVYPDRTGRVVPLLLTEAAQRGPDYLDGLLDGLEAAGVLDGDTGDLFDRLLDLRGVLTDHEATR